MRVRRGKSPGIKQLRCFSAITSNAEADIREAIMQLRETRIATQQQENRLAAIAVKTVQ
jgi:hypothetical protein